MSALIVLATLPLVPVFMALIGWYTQRATEDSLHTIERLAGRFADVIAGLPTLVVFGRVRAQARAVGAAAEDHRLAAARTLRVAFLSSMVLELVATLSVALVAVTCGIRLISGGVDIETALIVLLLAPEAYNPLRAVGAGFHAAADGAAAVQLALQIIDEPGRPVGTRTDTAAVPSLRIADVRMDFADGRRLTVGSHDFPAGKITVMSGPSGTGKSTLLNVLAALDFADHGRVLVLAADGSELDLAEIDRRHWFGRIGRLGQRVALRPGALRENLTAGRVVSPDRLHQVMAACRLPEVLAELPDGLDTVVGPGARELSTGQRRRVGLARALLADAPVLLLDEPTEGLDAATESAVLQRIRPLLAGRTVVITTHRPAVLDLADRRIELSAGVALTERELVSA
jgi:ABC-type transport system involved in cytochrome bd biosynthesis fused ATPase/permease subunit